MINGREDEGNSFIRFKEELIKKNIKFDQFWLNDIYFDNSGLRGFPIENNYKAVLLANPEPLESDSAPIFLLKSKILETIAANQLMVPEPKADLNARSKLHSLEIFGRWNISTPTTFITSSIHDAFSFIKEQHSKENDVVIKPIAKGGGWAVSKIPRSASEKRIFDTLGKYKWWYGGGVLYLQKFVENGGFDKRVLMVGDLVIGTEKRNAITDKESWIYNISKGAIGSNASLSEEELFIARKAFEVTNQFFSGIDLIADTEGQNFILEVNSCPGFKGFEKFLNINVASFVLDYISFFS